MWFVNVATVAHCYFKKVIGLSLLATHVRWWFKKMRLLVIDVLYSGPQLRDDSKSFVDDRWISVKS